MTKIILDCCCNHLGDDLMIAEMIAIAGRYDVDYVKFQLYDSDKIDKNLYSPEYIDFMKKCEIDKSKMDNIFYCCDIYKVTRPMFTVFHEEKIDMLSGELDYAIKIASCDSEKGWVNGIVIFANQHKKPIYISLGMCDGFKKDEVVKKYKHRANLLSCVSMYPCCPEDLDIEEAMLLNGMSCHTDNIPKIKELLSSGIENLELHFTLSKHLPGVDQKYAIDPTQLEYIIKYRRYLEDVKKYKKRFIGAS